MTKDPAGGAFVAYFDDLVLSVPEPAAPPAAAAAIAALTLRRLRTTRRHEI